MDGHPGYLPGYAVIRIDGRPLDSPSRVCEYTVEGVTLPTAGPWNVRVKEVVTTAEEARREVIRLNALNAGKGCCYFWQATHIFLDGRSHGSTGRAEEAEEPA